VNYAMSGTAIEGTDYTLNTFTGQIVIQRGATTGSVTLNAADSSSAGDVVATMTLQPGSGYGISSPSAASVTISFSDPTSAEYWIAVRTDGQPGSGTEADPFDGSTQARFDALMASMPANTTIHLGPGTFQTAATHSWFVRSGWDVEGAGMYLTTVQLVGDASTIFGAGCFLSDPNLSTDNATISNLTADSNWPELSATAPDGVGGEKDFAARAVVLYGSNNLVDHVRAINSYGSAANHRELFDITLSGSRFSDGSNDVIQFCDAELPRGTYGNPFALQGWRNSTPYYVITNSKVLSCTAVGVNNGLNTGFTSGGVNLANVKDCVIDGNTFTDCYGAAYMDTGSVDGLQVSDNTVIRGWQGVGLANSTMPKQNIQITGNNFYIQNRIPDGGSYGIVTAYGVTTNLTIDGNTITFDPSGNGMLQFWGIATPLLNNATISNNVIGLASCQLINTATGTGLIMFNNTTPDGTPIPGLNNQ
jgi:hypothetical protein